MDRRRSEVGAGSLALDSCSRRWTSAWHPYLGSDRTLCLALRTTNKNFGCMPRSIATSVISRPIPRHQLAPVWHAGLGNIWVTGASWSDYFFRYDQAKREPQCLAATTISHRPAISQSKVLIALLAVLATSQHVKCALSFRNQSQGRESFQKYFRSPSMTIRFTLLYGG
jgi:hypothetical protein